MHTRASTAKQQADDEHTPLLLARKLITSILINCGTSLNNFNNGHDGENGDGVLVTEIVIRDPQALSTRPRLVDNHTIGVADCWLLPNTSAITVD